MGRLDREAGEIHAKIVYCGPQGAGKTANLQFIHRKLKREHRGELRVAHAGKDKKGAYEMLPVQLGAVRGLKTSLHVQTTPGAPKFADERRRALEGVDGVIFVADLRPDRHEATLKSLEELQQHLESYGRGLEDVLLVLQYNRRDEGDETSLEKLHARLGVKPEATFEAIAADGTGVLQCLTTLSKAILSKIRREADNAESADAVRNGQTTFLSPSEDEAPSIEPVSGQAGGFSVESSGPVTSDGPELRIPLRLTEDGSGRKIELSIRVSIDT